MLSELQNIRYLLTTPTPTNIRTVTAEMEKLAAMADGLSVVPPEGRALLRREVSSIQLLTQAASAHLSQLTALRTSAFGAYGRTGLLQALDASHTIDQL